MIIKRKIVYSIFIFLVISFFIFNMVSQNNTKNKERIIEVNDFAQVIYPVSAAACRCMIVEIESDHSNIIDIGLKEKEFLKMTKKKLLSLETKSMKILMLG